MARLTRHELKQDEFLNTFEQFEAFAKKRYKEILTVAALVIVVTGTILSIRFYNERQEAESNALLAQALRTFHAQVGSQPSEVFAGQETFPTLQDKYKKALAEFNQVTRKYPREKAAALARYHAGLCQAELGDEAGALKTLAEAARAPDRNLASLGQLALAGEYARAGKTVEAAKIYRQLEDHPTSTVPRATAMLALADAYRQSQPAEARRIYQQMEKEFAAEPELASNVREQMNSLPK